ncbi:MAG: D-alanyl-D-alanine carboxypeptidase/D-alanyl-D-alanine-endopeptidase [Bacteroidota bacterium]
MMRISTLFLVALTSQSLFSQQSAFEAFLADSSMRSGSVSFHLIDAKRGSTIYDHNSGKSLIPASVLKLVTTSAALELLRPDHTFTTAIGYIGTLNSRTGVLKGNIIIKGGGDPVLGSKAFYSHYADFEEEWVEKIKKAGIRKIKGKVVTDDSYFDYQPVPGKWLWEDTGNYYGAGAFGLSLYDNSYEIHFRTSSDGLTHEVTGIFPEECRVDMTDMLTVSGTEDHGYVYATPYSTTGWMAGTIPAVENDFVLGASITDPPLLMARMLDNKMRNSGIKTTDKPSTVRLQQGSADGFVEISNIISPPLIEILCVLNHESVNLYAEHLVKELGKRFKDSGSTDSGLVVIDEFLKDAGINSEGIFMEDGSGLSPLNSVSAEGLTGLLFFMKTKSKHPDVFINSLPEAGREGTLKNYFRDPVFENRLVAKSGSMTRVRAYAGYLEAVSGKELIFCIIVNNFTGPSRNIVTHIENILKETILSY